jgi:hypothetical protein
VCLFAGSTGAGAQDYLIYADPAGRFEVRFPRDWRWFVVAGAGEPLALFVQRNDEAAVVVERARLNQKLAPTDITDLFAELEADYVKASQPYATGVTARKETNSGGPVIILDYTRLRPGRKEADRERVRQYSVPLNDSLYRITCSALLSRFSRYEKICETVSASLTPDPGQAAK